MSKTKFSNGDWFKSLDGCIYAPVHGDCKKVCTINTVDIFASKEEEANAHLIAAAPEMYAALESMVEYCHLLEEKLLSNNIKVSNIEKGNEQPAEDIAECALAKARGES